MKLELTHQFNGVNRDQYITMFFDSEFNEMLAKNMPVKERREIRRTETDRELVRVLRIVPDITLPAAAAKFTGTDRIVYEEEHRWRKGGHRIDWRTIPNVLAEKLSAQGHVDIVDVPGGVKRVISGDIVFKMFGVGGKVEKIIVTQFENAYAQAARLTQDWISQGRAV